MVLSKKIQFNPSTLRIIRNTATGKVLMDAASGYQYSELDCCCFLEPETEGHCNNADWDSFPPFGGVGKTPLYYILSVHMEGTKTFWEINFGNCTQEYENVHAYYTLDAVLKVKYTNNCLWETYEVMSSAVSWHYSSHHPTSGYQCDGDGEISFWEGSIDLQGSPSEIFLRLDFLMDSGSGCSTSSSCFARMGLEQPCPACSNAGINIEINDCEISGSATHDCSRTVDAPTCPGLAQLTSTNNTIVSWRPFDCNFTVWDSSTSYALDDCVSWNGKFYTCKLGHTNQEPPNVTYWTDVS